MDTIWLIEYNTQRDGWNGWDWDCEIDYDWGFYLSEQDAKDAADARNHESLARLRESREKSYAASLKTWETNKAKHEALTAAGLETGEFKAPEPTLNSHYNDALSVSTNLRNMGADY